MTNTLQLSSMKACLIILSNFHISTLPAPKDSHVILINTSASNGTCITHVVAEWSPWKVSEATGVIGGLWVLAQLTLGSGSRVGTEVSRIHGRHCLPAGVIAGFSFTDPFEDMVESQNMPHLMDHDVGVARHAVIGWIEDNTTCNGRFAR